MTTATAEPAPAETPAPEPTPEEVAEQMADIKAKRAEATAEQGKAFDEAKLQQLTELVKVAEGVTEMVIQPVSKDSKTESWVWLVFGVAKDAPAPLKLDGTYTKAMALKVARELRIHSMAAVSHTLKAPGIKKAAAEVAAARQTPTQPDPTPAPAERTPRQTGPARKRGYIERHAFPTTSMRIAVYGVLDLLGEDDGTVDRPHSLIFLGVYGYEQVYAEAVEQAEQAWVAGDPASRSPFADYVCVPPRGSWRYSK